MTLETDRHSSGWLPASTSRPVMALASSPASGHGTCAWLVEFQLGLGSLPYLADHGFHDLVVVPGSFQVELVRQVHREIFKRDALILRRIEFTNPVILSEEEITISVRVDQRDDGGTAYQLYEATADRVMGLACPAPFASLEVAGDQETADSHDVSSPWVPLNPDEWRAHAIPIGMAAEFYAKLRLNGNQFGREFQILNGVWQSGAHAVARVTEDPSPSREVACRLSPPMLDAASQLLATFALGERRTFILKSIERLLVRPPTDSSPTWIHASRTSLNHSIDSQVIGDVTVVDGTGRRLWELSGVTLKLVDGPETDLSAPASTEIRLCIASTFTAEPIEDTLTFWGRQFGQAAQVSFAPYNQVFQQLLDPASAFHGNRNGINLIVLSLDDWLQPTRPLLSPVDRARAAAQFGDRPRCMLPNGLEIVDLNRHETDYVYREIFTELTYLRHGIEFQDGDTVVDIGANIGLFSLFALSRCRNASVYAYEPSQRVFDLLQANCTAYGDPARVHVFNYGVGERKGSAPFTFYEESSVFSSFHPNPDDDRAAVEAVARNILQQELSDRATLVDADIRDLTAGRLRATSIECPLISVSDIMHDNHLERIHLLKIDAEKSEMEIIRGISEAHWPLIDQIVMEVHDRTGMAVKSIEANLTARGFRCAVVGEELLENSGLFNVYATRRHSESLRPAGLDQAVDGFRKKAGEFCDALDTFAATTAIPVVLAVAPRSADKWDRTLRVALDETETFLLERVGHQPQIRLVSSQTIQARHPELELHDPHSDQLGHMPFTPAGYAAIGTEVFRNVFNLVSRPVKVIVLDCDNTLWQGLCGEDGPGGIAMTPPFRHLQEFMIGQMQAGVLLALCSKNHEADVLAVFDQRTELPLRREHLAGWRINWESKPANLRALAGQFKLSLDSFVFIDDNPVECAAVRAECPEVVVLQLPRESDRIPAFLGNMWILDHAHGTQEDGERNQWYHADSKREKFRTTAPSLREFIEGLDLRVEVAAATDEQLGRVAQLTVRTNQFNFTSIRRSEPEIRDFIRTGGKCLVASVMDRFGDYGLVGVILYSVGADRMTVDTFLLSCRALGKGVEHRMLAELAARAVQDDKATIELPFRKSERNEPAREFIARLAPWPVSQIDGRIERPAAALAQLRYHPDYPPPSTAEHVTAENDRSGGFDRGHLSRALQRLGEQFISTESVVAAIEAARQAAAPGDQVPLEPGNNLEQSLAAIWKKVLGRTRIGLNENFFDSGGTSIKAVTVVAMIRKEFKRNVSIVTLFECPTIRLFAAKLDDTPVDRDGPAAITNEAGARGRQRRNRLAKRRAA